MQVSPSIAFRIQSQGSSKEIYRNKRYIKEDGLEGREIAKNMEMLSIKAQKIIESDDNIQFSYNTELKFYIMLKYEKVSIECLGEFPKELLAYNVNDWVYNVPQLIKKIVVAKSSIEIPDNHMDAICEKLQDVFNVYYRERKLLKLLLIVLIPAFVALLLKLVVNLSLLLSFSIAILLFFNNLCILIFSDR